MFTTINIKETQKSNIEILQEKSCYINKFRYPRWKGQILRKTKTITSTQEVIKGLNRHTSKETELVVKTLVTKSPGTDRFTVNSIRHLRRIKTNPSTLLSKWT